MCGSLSGGAGRGLGGGGFKKWGGAGFDELFGDQFAESLRAHFGAPRFVMNADRFAGCGIRDDCEDLLPLPGLILRGDAAVDADGDLAASAKCGESGALGSDGEAGRMDRRETRLRR